MLEWSHYEAQIQLVWDSLNNKNKKETAGIILSEAVVSKLGVGTPMSDRELNSRGHEIISRVGNKKR